MEESMRRVVALALLFVVGCVSPMKTQFDEAPMKGILEPGTGRIAGQAFTKTRGGEVRTPSEVLLVPFSPYTEEVCRRGALIPEQWFKPEIDSRIYNYLRRAQCDSEGRFAFESLPDGDYLLTCGIYWEIPSSTGRGTEQTGANVTGRFRLSPETYARAEKVILTNH